MSQTSRPQPVQANFQTAKMQRKLLTTETDETTPSSLLEVICALFQQVRLQRHSQLRTRHNDTNRRSI